MLDEPLAGLDGEGAREVLAQIRRLAADHRVAVVVVEHMLNVPRVLDLVTEVWTIRDRRIVVESPQDVCREYAEATAPSLPPWVEWIVGSDAEYSTVEVSRGALLHIIRPLRCAGGDRVLEIEGLVVRRKGCVVVGGSDRGGQSPGVSLSLPLGALAILAAPNGWGKTTLVEAMAGFLECDGAVRLGGHDLGGLSVRERTRAGLAVLQSSANGFGALTACQALRVAGISGSCLVTNAILDRRVNSLSGGEQQVLAVEMALRQGCFTAAVLDEPFQSLDEQVTKRVCAHLKGLLSGRAILVTLPAAIDMGRANIAEVAHE
jgi:ABC-type multidrug transport system ATPase subunit